MVLTQHFYLDIVDQPLQRLKVVNGDTANQFVITITNKGNAITLDATLHKIVAVFRRSDGRIYTQDSGTGLTFTSGGVVTIDVYSSSFRTGTNKITLLIFKRDSSTSTEYPLLLTTQEQTFNARAAAIDGESQASTSQMPMLERYVLAAKSYANGNTGTREGEDTDNAEYYWRLARSIIDDDVVSPSVENWLDNNADRLALLKEYVTPEMYGAVGDGTTDDTAAVQSAVNSGKIVWGHGKTYLITSVTISNDCDIRDCVFYKKSIAQTLGSYAFFVGAADLNISFSECSFTSDADKAENRQDDDSYTSGLTSNVGFIRSNYSVTSITCNRCRFVNAYYAIYLTAESTSHLRVSYCEFVNHVTGVDFAYCSDAIISNSKFTQSQYAKGKAHDIYVAQGTSNKALIQSCTFESYGISISCNHGGYYDLTISDCIINSHYFKPIVATDEGGGDNHVTVNNSFISCTEKVCDSHYDTTYEFNNCVIKCTEAGKYVINDTSEVGHATFNNCTIIGRLLTHSRASFINCAIMLYAGSKSIIYNAGTDLIGCSVRYSSTHATPIYVTGNSRIINSYFNNSETTTYAVRAENTENLFKGNVFENIPESAYGTVDLTENIFV